MSGLTSILGGASAIAGLGAAVGAGASVLAARVGTKAQTSLLDLQKEQVALQSTDIQVLGSYLYDNVGTTRISAYVRDKDLRARVTRALETISSFLGADVPTDQEPMETETPQLPTGIDPRSVSEEMRKALQEIRFGEIWNGLARVRRHIELQLRQIASDVPADGFLPVGRLLNILAKTNRMPPDANNLLRYAIGVANAGIHGEEVDPGQAEEAWQCALAGLAILGQNRESEAGTDSA